MKTNGNGNGAAPVYNPPITIVVGGKPFATTWLEIPESNRYALAVRQLGHVMRNETAAAGGKLVETKLNIGELTTEAKKPHLQAFRENDETKAEWESILQAEADKKWDMLLNGAMSPNERTRVPPVEAEYLRLIDADVRTLLRGAKGADGKALSMPTNDVDTITFADGETWTRGELRDAIAAQESELAEFATKGEEYRAEAERRAKQPAPVKPAPTEPATAAALGLRKKAA